MITRTNIGRRNWSVVPGGIATPAVNAWQGGGPIRRGGPVHLNIPPTAIAMDPSNRSTWRRPVRFT
jgi:hypothetical protein